MDIVFMGDAHTATAFRLAGLKRVYEEDEAGKQIESVLADAGVGIVIVTERFAGANRSVLETHRSSKKITPIIVEVPESSGYREEKPDPIQELIKRAIGTDIKET